MPLVKDAPFERQHLTSKDNYVVLKYDKKGKLEEMLKIGMYALNKHSKSGVIKDLAEMGLRKVILGGLGIENCHKLTDGSRRRLIHEKPKIEHFAGKS